MALCCAVATVMDIRMHTATTVADFVRFYKTTNTIQAFLWVAFAFAGILGLSRSFAMEREAGAIYALMLSPADRGAI